MQTLRPRPSQNTEEARVQVSAQYQRYMLCKAFRSVKIGIVSEGE